MFLEKYFEVAKAKLELRSDAQLARHLGILPQDIVTAKRKGYLRDDVMLTLCRICEVSPGEIAAAREAEKAPAGSEMRAVWSGVQEAVKRAGAVAGIGAVLLSGSAWKDGSGIDAQVVDFTNAEDKDYRKLAILARKIMARYFAVFSLRTYSFA